MLYSPINYQGNKSRIVDKVLNFLPNKCDCIHEIFSGSAIVSLSSKSSKIFLNDLNHYILDLIKYFKDNEPHEIIKNTDNIITQYQLTNTFYEGKERYKEIKHEGLSRYNKNAFNKLKSDYNQDKDIKKLFVLIIYGFNHYLRFNRNDEFNVPVGKIDFVKTLRDKTFAYCNAIKAKTTINFTNLDFRDKELYLKEYLNDVFYFDPPYLITQTTYNTFWSIKDEIELLELLDHLNNLGFKFMLSNVIESNGKENSYLKEWMKKYNIHYINRQYLNSSYQKKNITKAIEVLITNY